MRSFTKLHAAEIVLALKIEPKLRARAKEDGKRECGLSIDGPFTLDDLVERGARNSRSLRKLGLRKMKSLKKFLLQDVSWSGREDGLFFAIHGGVLGFSGNR